MADGRVTRKLAAILAADVEGYTRLMRDDEEATLSTLSDYRDVIDNLIVRHDGRVFSTGGDSVLAEFLSAVEAVPKIRPIPCPVMVHGCPIVASRIGAGGYKLMRSLARTVEAIPRPAQSSEP